MSTECSRCFADPLRLLHCLPLALCQAEHEEQQLLTLEMSDSVGRHTAAAAQALEEREKERERERGSADALREEVRRLEGEVARLGRERAEKAEEAEATLAAMAAEVTSAEAVAALAVEREERANAALAGMREAHQLLLERLSALQGQLDGWEEEEGGGARRRREGSGEGEFAPLRRMHDAPTYCSHGCSVSRGRRHEILVGSTVERPLLKGGAGSGAHADHLSNSAGCGTALRKCTMQGTDALLAPLTECMRLPLRGPCRLRAAVGWELPCEWQHSEACAWRQRYRQGGGGGGGGGRRGGIRWQHEQQGWEWGTQGI